MQLSEHHRMLVYWVSIVEQWILLVGALWLIGRQGWSAWWIVLYLVLATGTSPSVIITALETTQHDSSGGKDGR